MTKFIVLASGTGGVGKTITAINLGSALNSFGRDVIVLDGNLDSPHLSIYLGAPHIPVSLHDVMRGENHISEALYLHSTGLKIIPGSPAIDNSDVVPERLADVLLDLVGTTEIVIIDSGSGVGDKVLEVLSAGDEIIIVTTPELPSVTESLKTIRAIQKRGKSILGIILTKVRKDELELTKADVESLLEHKVIGIIPEDDTIREANKTKHPVTYTHPHSEAAKGFKKTAATLIGQKYTESIEKKDTLGTYLLKNLGIK